jgi:DNA-binding transcriptional MerR regulator/methylmalonyl-CoA mutase cobalamin-binding subunit
VTDLDDANEQAHHTGKASVQNSDDPELTIKQAAQLLNVPAPTIRSWERRYQLPQVPRSNGGHRRYAGVQLDQLREMRDLIGRGRRPAEAAQLIKAGHLTAPEPFTEAFLRAAAELAPGSIAQTLDAARETLGLDRTIDDVLLPAMREVGESWQTGRIDVSHEHLATNACQAWLATLRPPAPLQPQPPIVLSCGPLDHHTLGLEALGALLRDRLWDCRMLGARTPAESLARAVAEVDAGAVVLVCHLNTGRRAAIETLRTLQLHRPLFYAGGAFRTPQSRHGVPGLYLGTNITQAAELITATLLTRSTS